MATAVRTKILMPTPRRAAQSVSSAAARRTQPVGLLLWPLVSWGAWLAPFGRTSLLCFEAGRLVVQAWCNSPHQIRLAVFTDLLHLCVHNFE